jgi:hypothetical protein
MILYYTTLIQKNLTCVKVASKKCKSCGNKRALNEFHVVIYNSVNGEKSCYRKVCAKCRSAAAQRTSLFKKHGITPERRVEILDEQNWLCAICEKELHNDRFTHLDHDHVTGKIRGMLCHLCNTSLGHFGDNVEGMLRVIRYLESCQ